jgi:hypothetical protein
MRKILSHLSMEPKPARGAIVVCEGARSWDNYPLLHHYDRTLTLDEMGDIQESVGHSTRQR